MNYEDLKCEFCDGKGEKEKFVEPYGDSPVMCSYCNGSGIHEDLISETLMLLAGLEDTLHGEEGKIVTKIRGMLMV